MNDFFEDLGARFSRAARGRGVDIEAPDLDPVVARELLDLARVAAHTQERRFAPLASFMAGVAVERLRKAGGPGSAEAAADLIKEVRMQLEAEAAPAD